MSEITEKQAAVLAFIRKEIDEHQMPPSQEEIRRAFGWNSPHSVTAHLKALAKKGYIHQPKGPNTAWVPIT